MTHLEHRLLQVHQELPVVPESPGIQEHRVDREYRQYRVLRQCHSRPCRQQGRRDRRDPSVRELRRDGWRLHPSCRRVRQGRSCLNRFFPGKQIRRFRYLDLPGAPGGPISPGVPGGPSCPGMPSPPFAPCIPRGPTLPGAPGGPIGPCGHVKLEARNRTFLVSDNNWI